MCTARCARFKPVFLVSCRHFQIAGWFPTCVRFTFFKGITVENQRKWLLSSKNFLALKNCSNFSLALSLQEVLHLRQFFWGLIYSPAFTLPAHVFLCSVETDKVEETNQSNAALQSAGNCESCAGQKWICTVTAVLLDKDSQSRKKQNLVVRESAMKTSPQSDVKGRLPCRFANQFHANCSDSFKLMHHKTNRSWFQETSSELTPLGVLCSAPRRRPRHSKVWISARGLSHVFRVSCLHNVSIRRANVVQTGTRRDP